MRTGQSRSRYSTRLGRGEVSPAGTTVGFWKHYIISPCTTSPGGRFRLNSATGTASGNGSGGWSRAGVFEVFFQLLAETSPTAGLVQMFDSTVVRAHVSAAGAKGAAKSGARSVERWIFVRDPPEDRLQRSANRFHLTGGEGQRQCPNWSVLWRSAPDIRPRAALTDKGYDSKANRTRLPPAWHRADHFTCPLKHEEQAQILPEIAIQNSCPHRTGGRQIEALQTGRASM